MKNSGRGESVSRGDSTAAINRENSLFRETIPPRKDGGRDGAELEREEETRV